MSYLRYICFDCMWWCPTHNVVCFCFVCLCLVYPMLPVSLDCPCIPYIASSPGLSIFDCPFGISSDYLKTNF
jgi:hypothetical protein